MTAQQIIMRRLKRGDSNADVQAFLRRKLPAADVSLATINWYRNALRRCGNSVPTEKEARQSKKG